VSALANACGESSADPFVIASHAAARLNPSGDSCCRMRTPRGSGIITPGANEKADSSKMTRAPGRALIPHAYISHKSVHDRLVVDVRE
jgi:hypothetical protein